MDSRPKPQSSSSSIAVFGGAVGKAALIMLAHPLWGILSQFNTRLSPSVPWSAPLMLIILWLLWRFLDGQLGLKQGADARRKLLKARGLSGKVWLWALVAGGLAMVSMAMIDTHSCQFVAAVASNADAANAVAQLPLWTSIAFFVVMSMVAAVVEESAFRGYMQSDLERRFHILPTIGMVAVVFAVFHLYGRTWQQWTAGFVDWVVISAVFSALVYFTGSILPAMICHFTVDLGLFSLDWFDDPLRPLREIVPRAHMSLGTIICGVSAIAALLAFRHLAKVTAAVALSRPADTP